MSDAFLAAARDVIGSDHVLTHSNDIASYIKEYGGKLQGIASCVLRPANTTQVSALVRLCAEHKISITPQGGNTGLVGGSVPYSSTACVLTLERMNTIRTIDPENFSMTVDAGCVLQTIQETAATLKLFPDPGHRETCFAALPSLDDVVAWLSELRTQFGNALLAYEVMAQQSLHYSVHYGIEKQAPLKMDAPWYVLIEITQHDSAQIEQALARAFETQRITDATMAQNETQRRALWHVREIASDAAQSQDGGSIKHDISVAIVDMPAFVTQADALAHSIIPDVKPAIFGHAGDGNLHYDLTKPDAMSVEDFRARWHDVNHALHDLVGKFNGSFAAEHGIGVFKATELIEHKDAVTLGLMHAVKQAFDPDARMNPGVLFPQIAVLND